MVFFLQKKFKFIGEKKPNSNLVFFSQKKKPNFRFGFFFRKKNQIWRRKKTKKKIKFFFSVFFRTWTDLLFGRFCFKEIMNFLFFKNQHVYVTKKNLRSISSKSTIFWVFFYNGAWSNLFIRKKVLRERFVFDLRH